MKPTQVLPVLVGLSLCGASAALLYVWYKTKDEQKDEVDSAPGGNLFAKFKTKGKEKVTKVECTIANDLLPLVLGRGGANIKSIEDSTNTKIEFREKDAKNQVCEISGAYENVMKAANLVKEEASRSANVTDEMIVPQSAYSKIIGRFGKTLQDICRKSLTQIHIDAGVYGDQSTRRVVITGSRANVNMAKRLIEEKVREDAEEQGVENKREPRGSPRSTASVSSESLNKDFTPPTSHIEVNKERLVSNSTLEGQLEIYVSAIATPEQFWVQLVGPHTSKLDELVEEMTAYYNQPANQKLHRIADPRLGQIVTAMFKFDSKFYRAEIVNILPNEFDPRNVVLDLYFVDYGDSTYVQPDEVFELRTDFLTLRFQAIECFLANCQPKHPTLEGQWNKDAVDRFEELTYVARWKKLVAKVVTTIDRVKGGSIKQEASPVPGVELFDIIDGNEINIGHQLIAEGFAINDYNNESSNTILRLDGGHSNSPLTTSIDVTPESEPRPQQASPMQKLLNIVNNEKLNNSTNTSNDQHPQPHEQQQQQQKRPQKQSVVKRNQQLFENVAARNSNTNKKTEKNNVNGQSNGHVMDGNSPTKKQNSSKHFIDNEKQLDLNKATDLTTGEVFSNFDAMANTNWNDIVEAEQNS